MTENDPYRSFESGEELVQFLTEARESLRNRPLADEQQALGWGDRAVRFMDTLVIFAAVVSQEALAVEDIEVRDQLDYNARVNGLLYALSYSTVVPDGEYGSHHRSVLWPIENRVFEAARRAGWDVNKMDRWAQDSMESAYYGLTDHLARTHD